MLCFAGKQFRNCKRERNDQHNDDGAAIKVVNFVPSKYWPNKIWKKSSWLNGSHVYNVVI